MSVHFGDHYLIAELQRIHSGNVNAQENIVNELKRITGITY